MSFREQLIALRSRCRGSRLKTYTNLYRAAWKSGEALENPEAVYLRIKDKHLVFAESKEEKEVRIDNEHVLLQKGRLSAHQFEPLFEASVSELEAIGLGKTPLGNCIFPNPFSLLLKVPQLIKIGVERNFLKFCVILIAALSAPFKIQY